MSSGSRAGARAGGGAFKMFPLEAFQYIQRTMTPIEPVDGAISSRDRVRLGLDAIPSAIAP